MNFLDGITPLAGNYARSRVGLSMLTSTRVARHSLRRISIQNLITSKSLRACFEFDQRVQLAETLPLARRRTISVEIHLIKESDVTHVPVEHKGRQTASSSDLQRTFNYQTIHYRLHRFVHRHSCAFHAERVFVPISGYAD